MEERDQSIPDQFVTSSRFDDFDRFTEQTRGWEFDLRQLDRGSFEAEVTQLVTPSILISEFALGRKIEQRGAIPEGFRTIGIPAEESPSIRWRGKVLDSEHLMLFPPGSEIDCVSEPGFHAYGLSISEQVLQEVAERRHLARVDDLFPGVDTVLCLPGAQQQLRRLVRMLMDEALRDPEMLNNPWFRLSLDEYLIELLFATLETSKPEEHKPLPTRNRSSALKKALHLIAQNAKQPMSIADLEHQSGASGRTLRYAFQEEFGLSPKQYLQAYRLNRIHRELSQNPAPGLTVAEVAKSWGFWHMGQFAADYRALFGQVPSETLARARKTD